MSKEESRLQELKKQHEREYQEYIVRVEAISAEYGKKRDRYNEQVALINNERFSMREELKKLYDFLKAIGGNLGDRITPFDFATEFSASELRMRELGKIESPNMKDGFGLTNFSVRGAMNTWENQEKLEEYENTIIDRKSGYEKDLLDRETAVKYLDDACPIAEIYRNIVVTVRDTVKEKIIPEMQLIQAFLFADAIREAVAEGGNLEEIARYNIVTYKGTRYDVHYQFVKNTFDFYETCNAFFRKKILTNMLEDQKITEEEKKEFHDSIENLKKQISALEQKMMGN